MNRRWTYTDAVTDLYESARELVVARGLSVDEAMGEVAWTGSEPDREIGRMAVRDRLAAEQERAA
jgi:hypothetical protein